MNLSHCQAQQYSSSHVSYNHPSAFTHPSALFSPHPVSANTRPFAHERRLLLSFKTILFKVGLCQLSLGLDWAVERGRLHPDSLTCAGRGGGSGAASRAMARPPLPPASPSCPQGPDPSPPIQLCSLTWKAAWEPMVSLTASLS